MKQRNKFEEITGRLNLALNFSQEAQLREALGFAPAAWSKRKARESLPETEIAALIEREGISAEYIWRGTGPVHVAIDGQAWEEGLVKRLASTLGLGTYRGILVSQGYKDKDLKAVVAGKQAPPMALLRDLHLHLGIDLNWLICDQPGVSAQERGLIENYRRATEDGKRLIEQAATFAATAATK